MRKLWLWGLVMLICIASAMATINMGYNVTQYKNTTSTIIVGNLSSFRFVDKQFFNVSEKSGASPAIDLRCNFTNMSVGTTDYIYFDIYAAYKGSTGKEVLFQAWNYSANAWSTVGVLPYAATIQHYNFYAKRNDTKWVNTFVMTRFIQNGPGNNAYRLAISKYTIQVSDIEPPPEAIDISGCPTGSEQETWLYIFIGVFLIGLALFASYTSILFLSLIVGIFGIFYSFQLYACNWIFGGVFTIASIFYILYETFFRKFGGD